MGRRRLTQVAVLGGLSLVVGLAALVSMPVVPRLVGRPYDRAEAALADAHLSAEPVSLTKGDEGRVVLNQVLSQAPAPGTRLWWGTPVHFEFVQEPARSVVPTLAGLWLSDAVDRLDSHGFPAAVSMDGTIVVDLGKRFDPHRAVVTSCSPSPGAFVARGSRVTLVARMPRTGSTVWAHQEAVKARGSEPCFQCHSEGWCSGCHVRADSKEKANPSVRHEVKAAMAVYLRSVVADALTRWPAPGNPAGPAPAFTSARARGPKEWTVAIRGGEDTPRRELFSLVRDVVASAFTERSDLSTLTVAFDVASEPPTPGMRMTFGRVQAGQVRDGAVLDELQRLASAYEQWPVWRPR